MVNVKGLIDLAEYIDEPEQLKELNAKMGVSVNRFDELLRDMMNYAVYWDEEIKCKTLSLKELIDNKWKHFSYLHKEQLSLDIN